MANKTLFVKTKAVEENGGSYMRYDNPIYYGYTGNGGFVVVADDGTVFESAPGIVTGTNLVTE